MAQKREKNLAFEKPEWEWAGEPFDPMEYFGFVYQITHVPTGRRYIGKRQFKSKITRPPLKGYKRKRVEWRENDWRKYWGSSDWVLDDLERDGPEAFHRRILALCVSKGDLTYTEAKIQFDLNVLTETLPDGSKAFYNSAIGNRDYGWIKPETLRTGDRILFGNK